VIRAWKQRALTIPGIGIPAVVVNSELAGCCAERGPDEQTLRFAGLGVPP
jgi:hypothetical protein